MTLPAPLVPPSCDLRDFLFTPVEFQRLFSSETWLLSNDAEKIAAITLWGVCWTQVPAGSIPSDDRLLAHLSSAGARWKRVKGMALRGWVLCDDGRYYHPVMCEKVLEAWLEKITARTTSAAGNLKRWGAQADMLAIAEEYREVRRLLGELNPKSRSLQKSIPKGLLEAMQDAVSVSRRDSVMEPASHPGGMPDGLPAGVPSGSQGTGTGNISTAASRAYPREGSPCGDRVDQVGMTLDWCPGDGLAARMLMAGIPADLDTLEVRSEFVAYWHGKGARASPTEWDHKYFQRLMASKSRGEQGAKQHGGAGKARGGSGGGGRGSVGDRLRAANGSLRADEAGAAV